MTSAVTQEVTQFSRPTCRLRYQQKAGARQGTNEDISTASKQCAQVAICVWFSREAILPSLQHSQNDEVRFSSGAVAAAGVVEHSAGRSARLRTGVFTGTKVTHEAR